MEGKERDGEQGNEARKVKVWGRTGRERGKDVVVMETEEEHVKEEGKG